MKRTQLWGKSAAAGQKETELLVWELHSARQNVRNWLLVNCTKHEKDQAVFFEGQRLMIGQKACTVVDRKTPPYLRKCGQFVVGKQQKCSESGRTSFGGKCL
ncbi:hypothetical protein T11_6222 [Trichinella zimbabwensis]|uniref:Uncharacterized protein n=1 Tax=Trichinella zimbabwensis TaxID=268475 RepID=A0A0V1GPL9_9BILA|nr:hypothetical protein T11_6222 [Trichinella zimbabwensis]